MDNEKETDNIIETGAGDPGGDYGDSAVVAQNGDAAQKPSDNLTDKPADILTDNLTDTLTDKPADNLTDILTFKPLDRPADNLTDKPADRLIDKPADKLTGVILWSAFLTAVFTSVVVIVLLRFFGLLSLSGAVDFRGSQRSVASVQKLQQVWDALNKDFYKPVDGDRMIEYAAAGMVNSLGDIYSTYYTRDEMKSFSEHSSGIFHGIGVYVLQGGNGRLRITGFLENSPALEAGVQLDDEITSVDGVDVSGVTDSSIIIEMIKGEVGTVVTVGFYRPSDALIYEFPIERREIKTDNIFSNLLYAGGGAGGASGGSGAVDADAAPVGYIYIKMFDSAASEYFNRHLDKLLESGIVALIIDLRGNTGGDFEETVKIADRLMGEGIIVYTEDRAGEREYRESDAVALDLPLRILIDGDSASASEILAGAVKDSGAGRLLGVKTFGKGLVQAVIRLNDGSGLKYTRSRYFTPSGLSIDGIGIEPDVLIEPAGRGGSGMAADSPQNDDVMLNAALSDIEELHFIVDKVLYE